MNPSSDRLNALIDIVLSEGGSDLHLSPGSNPIIRIAGSLVPLLQEPVLTPDDTEKILKETLPADRYQRFLDEQSIDFAYAYKDKLRLRMNGYFTNGAIVIAMRLIPHEIRTFAQLNLPPVLEVFSQRQQGFFLCVGPVGQGKSTTLAALIDRINETRSEHIVTIEDPVEYIIEPKKSLIHQREVHIDTPDFGKALQAAFREDVDVIMVGEMRDIETVSNAVTAAETGHLVLSTLHTNNAAQTIDRIIDMFPSTQQAQVPAYELLINNNAVANMIREGRTHEINTIIQTSSQDGMIDMDRSLAELVRRGEITIEDAYERAFDQKTFERYL